MPPICEKGTESSSIEVTVMEKEGRRKGKCCLLCFPTDSTRSSTLSKYGLGVFLILCVTVIWVASSEWIQFIFGTMDFNKPFFLTYFNTSGFALWNFGYLCLPSWRDGSRAVREDAQEIILQNGKLETLPSPFEKKDGEEYQLQQEQAVADDLCAGYLDYPRFIGVEEEEEAEGGEEASKEPFRRTPPHQDGEGQELCVPSPLLEYSLGGQLSRMCDEPLPGAWEVGSTKECTSSSFLEEKIGIYCSPLYKDYADGEGEHSYFTHFPFHTLPPSSTVPAIRAPLSIGKEEDEEEERGRERIVEGSSSITLPSQSVYTICQYSRKRIWKTACIFCPFWFFANYLFNLSLSYTSVSSNTIMSAMGTVWTILLSRVFLHAPIGEFKLAGAVICVSGSIFVGWSASSETRSTTFGNLMALLSSIFYAIYTFVLRWFLPDDERYSMGQVFGAVGVMNILFFWPGFFLLDTMELEAFLWPSIHQLLPLMVNALIGTNLSDVLWARSVILTSPVVATMGLSLTTPLSMLVDGVLHGATYPIGYVIGAIFVVTGFVVANAR